MDKIKYIGRTQTIVKQQFIRFMGPLFKCRILLSTFSTRPEPLTLEKCSELPVPARVRTHVIVRIANSSVLYDLLQNDLKFISNKSFFEFSDACLIPATNAVVFVLRYSFAMSFCLSLLLWPICFTCIEKTTCMSVRSIFFQCIVILCMSVCG